MADVRLLTIATVVGGLALVRAPFPSPSLWFQVPLYAAAFGVLLFGRRAALVLVLVVAATMVRTEHNHLLFGFWTISTWALFPALAQRRFVLRWQLTILYTFTGLSKATGSWLSGAGVATFVEEVGVVVPVPDVGLQLAAAAALVAELTLAVLVWVPALRRPALAIGTALHLGIAASVLFVEEPLVFYNGLALLWLVDATRADDDPELGLPRRTDRPATVATG